MLRLVFLQLLVLLMIFTSTFRAFQIRSSIRPLLHNRSKGLLKMEYVPDGLTKEQWEAIKKKVKVSFLKLFSNIERRLVPGSR